MRRKVCKQCKQKFTPLPDLQRASVCSAECGLARARDDREKARQRAHCKQKQALRDKDRGFQMKETQKAFNAFIRLRDANKPCISCGRFHQGQYHAGHYRTTAAQPALRFNELNCNKQCAPCNNHKSGNITEYRIELVRRIGVDLVEWLEKDHKRVKPWSIEELKATKQYYKSAAKEMVVSPEADVDPF